MKYDESLNIVLQQELKSYNHLIELVESSLVELRKALKGQNHMSEDLKEVYKCLVSDKIPAKWKKDCYQTNRSLFSFLADLTDRL